EARRARDCRGPGNRRARDWSLHGRRSMPNTSPKSNPLFRTVPQKGHEQQENGSTTKIANHLTEVLDMSGHGPYSEPTLHRPTPGPCARRNARGDNAPHDPVGPQTLGLS